MHSKAQTDSTTPTKPIALLPDHLISQIAAGEVVERPASVVKELLENALDAGADALVIRIDGGGIQRISIQDNGCGIPKSQLPFAVQRHATSKIASLTDLESVSSLGFRGEALASIASVSQFSLSSATHVVPDASKNITTSGNSYAHCIHNHTGDWQIEPCALVSGTVVDVRDLYFCTPARRKFLKSEQAEFFACLDVIKRIALAYPDVQFEVYRDGKLYTRYAAMPHSQRIAKIVEVLSFEQSKPIGADVGELQLYGCIGLPEFARGRADAQYFYVNGRFVKDKLMTHAMRAAYQDVLHGDRHAAYVLFLQLPPHQVDVNVHPAKTEVRFRDAQAVHRWVRQVVMAALAEQRGVSLHAAPLSPSIHAVQHQSMPLPFRENPPLATHDVLSMFDAFKPEQIQAFTVPQSEGVYESSAPYGECVDSKPNAEGQPVASNSPMRVHDDHFLGEAIAQLNGTFILAQSKHGLVVVDVHAAHERVLYEQLKATLDAQAELPAQELLVPVLVDIQPQWSGVLPEAIALWARLGLTVSALSEHQLAVRTVPAMLKNRDVTALIQAGLHELHEHGVSHSDVEVRNAVLAGLACRQAVKANQHLSLMEMNALLRAMENTARANQCNHGRPTWRCFSWVEMDNWFMRGQ